MACVTRVDQSEYEIGDGTPDQNPNKSGEERENQSHMFKNFDSDLALRGKNLTDRVFHRARLFLGSQASGLESAYSLTSSGTHSFS